MNADGNRNNRVSCVFRQERKEVGEVLEGQRENLCSSVTKSGVGKGEM